MEVSCLFLYTLRWRMGNVATAPLNLHISTTGSECSVSFTCRFSCRESAPGANYTESEVGRGNHLDTLNKRISLPEIETLVLYCPVCRKFAGLCAENFDISCGNLRDSLLDLQSSLANCPPDSTPVTTIHSADTKDRSNYYAVSFCCVASVHNFSQP